MREKKNSQAVRSTWSPFTFRNLKAVSFGQLSSSTTEQMVGSRTSHFPASCCLSFPDASQAEGQNQECANAWSSKQDLWYWTCRLWSVEFGQSLRWDTTEREDLSISVDEVFLVDRGMEVQTTKLLCLRASVRSNRTGARSVNTGVERKDSVLSIHWAPEWT